MRYCPSSSSTSSISCSWRPASGTVKKTPLAPFSRPRASGIIAVDLRDDDRLVGVALTDGTREILLCTSGGKAIRFHEDGGAADGP